MRTYKYDFIKFLKLIDYRCYNNIGLSGKQDFKNVSRSSSINMIYQIKILYTMKNRQIYFIGQQQIIQVGLYFEFSGQVKLIPEKC